VPATPEATAALAKRIGYLRETIFGGFWDFTADLAKADTAYTNLELRPHTDANYALDAPGLQLFHCLEFAGAGGESILVDGFRIADELRACDGEDFESRLRLLRAARMHPDEP
jgi:trimethyllysine dioxygenase